MAMFRDLKSYDLVEPSFLCVALNFFSFELQIILKLSSNIKGAIELENQRNIPTSRLMSYFIVKIKF